MINFTDQLLNLHGYDYQVWEYSPVHSALTILATNKDKPNENVYLLFGHVTYVEMPMYWHGDFVLASDEEYVSIEEKSTIGKSVAAYPLSNRRRFIELYKVERPNGNIYLLGVRVQDIVNTFRHEFYLVEGSGHRERCRAM